MGINTSALAALREKDGQTKSQLAAKAGISPQYYGDIEAGRRGAKPEIIKRLAVALNVPQSAIEASRIAS